MIRKAVEKEVVASWSFNTCSIKPVLANPHFARHPGAIFAGKQHWKYL